MHKINKPTISASIVFSSCIGTMQIGSLRTRLGLCQSLIEQAEREFDSKITKGEIHTIDREQIVNGNVTIAELKKVYTGQLVPKVKNSRRFYDELLMSAKDGICPLCGHREATTLDHYLPKSHYPRLSVVPINLIPSCKDCNTGKLAEYPTSSFDETLHPYYDDIENVSWLKASVNRTVPISITFSVSPPVTWDDLLKQRVEAHVKGFNINVLYSSQAARRLSGMKANLQRIYDSGLGAMGVQRYLSNEADSNAAVNLNSWETALFQALAADMWFCQLGFQSIA